MEIVFLGTGSMFPTKKRAHPCVFVRDDCVNFIFDCGEGTQRQMRIAEISPTKLDYIFITHWHGDHTLGLAGLFQSLSANKRERKLIVCGPEGTSIRISHLLKVFAFDLRYPIEINEIKIKEGKISKIVDNEEFSIEAMTVKHGTPCINYSYIKKGKRKINLEYTKKYGLERNKILGDLQKGKTINYNGHKITPKQGTYVTPDKKITYITDTSYFKGLEKLAKNADLLISEGTFSDELEEKAMEYTHMTSSEAATLAKKAKAKKLVLTHFSQRYTDASGLKKEAKKVFDAVETAEDFNKFIV